jgi:hypothetical protein
VRDDEDGRVNATFELVAGTVAVIVAGFVAAGLFPAAEPAGRVVVLVLAVGLFAAVCTDWRSAAGVAIAAALVFVGFLTHRDAVLTGDQTPWLCTPLFGLAALLGSGYRWLAALSGVRSRRWAALVTSSSSSAGSTRRAICSSASTNPYRLATSRATRATRSWNGSIGGVLKPRPAARPGPGGAVPTPVALHGAGTAPATAGAG